MKASLLLSVLLVAASAAARPEFSDPEIKTELQRHPQGSVVLIQPTAPNEVQGRRFGFSGIAVQAVKTPNPLQLINPFAPPEYGSGEANVTHEVLQRKASRDTLSGETTEWKFLAIKF